MYYIELIQRFWSFNKLNNVGATTIAVYLYLLKIAGDNDRYDFKISDLAISKELGLTRKTVSITRDKLRRLGLIEFDIRKRVACSYRLIINYPIHFMKVDESEISVTEALNPTLETLLPVIDDNGTVSKSLDDDKAMLLESEIGFNKAIPSFDEFMEYAESLEQYDVQLNTGIKAKYESWKNNGWTSNANRPIANWKSSLKGALPFMKNLTSNEKISLQSVPDIKRPKES